MNQPSLRTSPPITYSSWNELRCHPPSLPRQWQQGIMLKKTTSTYQVGRRRGELVEMENRSLYRGRRDGICAKKAMAAAPTCIPITLSPCATATSWCLRQSLLRAYRQGDRRSGQLGETQCRGEIRAGADRKARAGIRDRDSKALPLPTGINRASRCVSAHPPLAAGQTRVRDQYARRPERIAASAGWRMIFFKPEAGV